MKVLDIMHKILITVSEDESLKEVGRLIFSLGIAGIPVVRGKKLVGIITEQDILAKIHPTMQEVIEDYVHAVDFDAMAKNIKYLLDITAGEAMNKNVRTVSPDTPVMEAHSTMLVHQFSRLPVINTKGDLVGIVSQGDIFREILKDRIPELEGERYAGFIARYYDQMVNWVKRFDNEFPELFKALNKEEVKSIIDGGSWTGEYTLGLAQRSNYDILGLDHNPIMVKMSQEKRNKLSVAIRKRVSFLLTNFKNLNSLIDKKFDAAIFMGNSFPYIPAAPEVVLKSISDVLRKQNPIIILQLLNFEKILKTENRLLSFTIQPSKEKTQEQLSIEFFDTENKNFLRHNVVIFGSDGTNWIYKGITTIEVHNIKKDDIKNALRKAGFRKISFFGNVGEHQGDYGKLSFSEPYKPLESDWLNVVAKR